MYVLACSKVRVVVFLFLKVPSVNVAQREECFSDQLCW